MRTAIVMSATIGLLLGNGVAHAAPAKAKSARTATLSLPPCTAMRRLDLGKPCMVDRDDPFAARPQSNPASRYLISDLRGARAAESDPASGEAEVRLRWMKVTASMRF
jgi:hypothetical protein